jgi:hypothetical protein
MQRRSLLLTTAGLALTAASGAQTPGHEDAVWRDATRERELPVRLRWPDGNGPCAVVIHSHGLGGSREGGGRMAQAWRAAGLAVIHLQHPGSDTEALRGGLQALRAAANARQLIARAADVRFAIDEIARRAARGEAAFQRLRLDAIGLSGHSFGARTVQSAAGQRFSMGGGAELAEARVRAFLALSPSMGEQQRVTPSQAFGEVRRPFFCATGSWDGDPLGSETTGEHRLRVFEGLPPGQRAQLWLDGADHMTFAGQHLEGRRALSRKRPPSAIEQADRHGALLDTLTRDWWRWHLQADPAARQALRQPQGLGSADRWTVEL